MSAAFCPSSVGKSSSHWLTKSTSLLLWMRGRGQACKQPNNAAGAVTRSWVQHTCTMGSLCCAPRSCRGAVCWAARPASMSPDLPRSPHWVEVGLVGHTCNSIKLAKQSVFLFVHDYYNLKCDRARGDVLWIIPVLVKRIHLENSGLFFGTMSQNSRKGHMEEERSPITLDGVSLLKAHQGLMITWHIPSPQPLAVWGTPAPHHHDNVAALLHHVFVPAHMWERDPPVLSSTRAVPGTVWTRFKVRLPQVVII